MRFQDLPVENKAEWDPEKRGLDTLQSEILGDPDNPDWERYEQAHLLYDPKKVKSKEGYKLSIARMANGRLCVVFSQLAAAVDALNSATGDAKGISEEDRIAGYRHAMKYFDKLGIGKGEWPTLHGWRFSKRSSRLLSLPTTLLQVDDEQEDGDGSPRWVQVATEGEYLGYAGGERPFQFTREIFEQIVHNLHLHPSYEAGPDGVGVVDLIPWDFGHCSERDPVEGSLPFQGAPAQGWSRDLEIRSGANGESQLWAFTHFFDLARGYIRAGQYKWPSVSIVFNAVDPITAEDVGPVLTSIALTNKPFIEGMEELVAAQRLLERARATSLGDGGYPMEELVKMLASKLGVRAIEAEVIAAIDELIDLRAGAKKILSADKSSNKVILEAAKETVGARQKLMALITALGVEDPDAAVERVAQLIEQGEQLKAAMPELEGLKAKVEKQEEEQAEADVSEVMSSRGYSDDIRDALLLYRKSDPNGFGTKYPRPAPNERNLTRDIATTSQGVDLNVSSGQATTNLGGNMIDLGQYPGANTTERAMSYIRATRDGAGKWTHDDVFVAACRLKNQQNVVDSQVQ